MSDFPLDYQNPRLFIGLMSGTSMDGIDGVLCSVDQDGSCKILLHINTPYTRDLKNSFYDLQKSIPNELHLEALAANRIAVEYAKVVQNILDQASLTPSNITAIGAHGQTIRHQPRIQNQPGYSIQSLNGSLLAELTNIDVVCDFRSRDIAAFGQGAPLVPAFHLSQFGNENGSKAILNLGGIANLTLLKPNHPILGFDTGPANTLLDEWVFKHLQIDFDLNGNWARSGHINHTLLEEFLSEPYFSSDIPKSTGRDLFNLSWLENKLSPFVHTLTPNDVQATLVELTAMTIVNHLEKYFPDCEEVIICGGGSKNLFLIERLLANCQRMNEQIQIFSTAEKGLDPQTIEAMAFAWLAWCFVERIPSSIPEVTGAKGRRILGALHPKSF
jgi:anhydro-N-acetylmuramic acid kinase